MNPKPLYLPWKEESFLSDERVQVMDNMAVWMYRTLLCRAFICTTRPHLPDDNRYLWTLAGCESRKQWEKYAPQVRQMFTPITVKGVKLLSQKRLILDFKKIKMIQRAKSESGVKSGIARNLRKNKDLQVNGRSTDVQRNGNENEQYKVSKEKLSEVKGSEGKEVTPLSPSGQEGEFEMSLKKDLDTICQQVLGIKPRIDMNLSSELSSLERAYPGQVSDDFKSWAEEQRGMQMSYPLQDYLKVATGRLAGTIMTTPSPQLQEFLDRVGHIAGNAVTFNRQQLAAINRMLKDYPLSDVFLGFHSFYNTLDDFSIKFAARDFAEKGAQIIRNRVQARTRQEEQQAMAEQLTAEGQAEVKRLQDEYEKRMGREAEAASDAPEL